jgi:hypothetical protein
MEMKKVVFIFVFTGVAWMSGSAIDNLRIPDLRTLSLGGGGVTETPLYNPALLATLSRHKIYANYYNRYSVNELATMSGGIYFTNNMIPVGIEITSFGYDEYRESLFRLSLGRRIAEKWTIGVATQFMLLQSELFEENSGRISADVGITYQPVDNLLTALSIMHLPSVQIGNENVDNKHIAAYLIQAGFNWKVTSMVLITGSADHSEATPFSGSFGMEYLPFENFKIRAGIRTAPLKPSLGVGYHFSNIRLDVGMLHHSVLGVSMGVGAAFEF